MEDSELAARVAVVSKAMKAFGVTDIERIKAIVDLTIGIPWLVPPVRGEEPKPPTPLFAAAVTRAALSKTFGPPGPGDILEAAIALGGTTRTDQGHSSPRRWVAEAMDPAKVLGIDANDLAQIGSGTPVRALRAGGPQWLS